MKKERLSLLIILSIVINLVLNLLPISTSAAGGDAYLKVDTPKVGSTYLFVSYDINTETRPGYPKIPKDTVLDVADITLHNDTWSGSQDFTWANSKNILTSTSDISSYEYEVIHANKFHDGDAGYYLKRKNDDRYIDVRQTLSGYSKDRTTTVQGNDGTTYTTTKDLYVTLPHTFLNYTERVWYWDNNNKYFYTIFTSNKNDSHFGLKITEEWSIKRVDGGIGLVSWIPNNNYYEDGYFRLMGISPGNDNPFRDSPDSNYKNFQYYFGSLYAFLAMSTSGFFSEFTGDQYHPNLERRNLYLYEKAEYRSSNISFKLDDDNWTDCTYSVKLKEETKGFEYQALVNGGTASFSLMYSGNYSIFINGKDIEEKVDLSLGNADKTLNYYNIELEVMDKYGFINPPSANYSARYGDNENLASSKSLEFLKGTQLTLVHTVHTAGDNDYVFEWGGLLTGTASSVRNPTLTVNKGGFISLKVTGYKRVSHGANPQVVKYAANQIYPLANIFHIDENAGARKFTIEGDDPSQAYICNESGDENADGQYIKILEPGNYNVKLNTARNHSTFYCEGSASSSLKALLEQAAPAAPELDSKSAYSVTLTAIDNAQYKINDEDWQDERTFTGLSPATSYTFYARLKETDTKYLSDSSPGTSITTLKLKQDAPVAPVHASISFDSITLDSIVGAEYKMDEGDWQDSTTFTGLDPATSYTFYARLKETGTQYASLASSPTIVTTDKAPQNAPDAPEIEDISASSVTLKLVEGAEYKIDNGDWQDETTFTGLSPATSYTFYARLKETATQHPSPESPPTSETTLKLEQDPPSAPELDSKSAYSVTLKEVDDIEYSIDGEVWQSTPIFTGLSPATSYTFYARLKETETEYPSPASSPTKITTDKASQAAPNAPELDIISAYSLTLKAIEGAEYKMEGRDWQASPRFDGLEPIKEYSFYARFFATARKYASLASPAMTVTTPKANQIPPPAPVITSLTTNSVTLKTIEGAEYKMDDGNWQTSSIFNGLNPATSYTFYARLRETTSHYASSVSIGTRVITPDKLSRILAHTASGISISGLLHVDARLEVGEGVLHKAGECAACDAVRQWMKDDTYSLLFHKDISLTEDFSGELTLTLNVGSEYNGSMVTILHCGRDGAFKTYMSTVEDGKVSFLIGGLSSFAGFARLEKILEETDPGAEGTDPTSLEIDTIAEGTEPAEIEEAKDALKTKEKNISQILAFLFIGLIVAFFLILKWRKK